MTLLSFNPIKNPFLYILIFLLGISLRFIGINNGLWIDEIWSLNVSSVENSAQQIIDICKRDTHPPLFDLLLHFFLKTFNNSDIGGRILALIIGVLGMISTLYYTYKISRSHFTSFMAFSLISLSFFHIDYSNEGRFYTLIYLFSIGIISHLYLFLKTQKKKDLLLFIAYSTLLSYTHYYGAILLVALSIIILALWILKEINLKTFLTFSFGGLLILILYSPWISYMFGSNKGSSWMLAPNLTDFFAYFYLYYTGKNPIEFLFLLFGFLFSIRFFKSNIKLYSLLIGTIILGFLIPYFTSLLTVPMLHYRYTFIYYPSIIIISSIVWEKIVFVDYKKKVYLFSFLVITIIGNFFYKLNYSTPAYQEPWREVTAKILENDVPKGTPIYAQLDFYIDVYLKLNDRENSIPLREIDEQPYSASNNHKLFWVLKTRHDDYELDLKSFNENYKVIKKFNFEQNFTLVLFQRI